MAISRKVLGKRLKAARGKKHTQEDVAEAVGLSAEQVSRIECGVKSVYLDKLSIWCDYLEVPITEVLGGADMKYGADQRFSEIVKDCPPEAVDRILDACENVAAAIRLASKENTGSD